MEPKESKSITPNSNVSLTLVISLLVGAITFTMFITNSISSLKEETTKSYNELANEVRGLKERLDFYLSDRWSYSDMVIFTERLKSLNPNINIPVVEKSKLWNR